MTALALTKRVSSARLAMSLLALVCASIQTANAQSEARSSAAVPSRGPGLIGPMLRVLDLDGVEHFYSLIGMKRVSEISRPGVTERFLNFDGSPLTPGILLIRDANDKAAPHGSGGLRQLVFRVPDADALAIRLNDAGVAIEGGVVSHGAVKVLKVRDPAGNLCELVEFLEPPSNAGAGK